VSNGILFAGDLFSGPRVRLTALRPGDVATVERWYEDSAFSRQVEGGAAFPRPTAWVQEFLTEGSKQETTCRFAVRLHHSDDMIGFIALDSILWTSRVAWLAIGIGEPAYRGQGYGGEALGLLQRFAFHELNLHRLQLTVFSYNAPAIRLYERLGFQREGVMREFLQRDGQRFDVYLYGQLAWEWEQRAG
jgi:RimJ/RimL family protein N-acetyltransferase